MVKHEFCNTEVMSLDLTGVTAKTSLARKATGGHLINSTSLGKTQSLVFDFCCAGNQVCDTVKGFFPIPQLDALLAPKPLHLSRLGMGSGIALYPHLQWLGSKPVALGISEFMGTYSHSVRYIRHFVAPKSREIVRHYIVLSTIFESNTMCILMFEKVIFIY